MKIEVEPIHYRGIDFSLQSAKDGQRKSFKKFRDENAMSVHI